MAEPTPVAPSDDGVVSASERFPEPFSPRLGWPILATCAGWALAYALLPLRYATNDDLAIVSSLRHGNETIFLSHLLNRALIALYRWLPEVPWFSGLVIAATIVGIALMVAAIRRRADDWTMPIAALLPLGLFGLECVAFTSFTSAALLLELGVVLTLFESALFGERPATSLLVALVSAALVSYGLRWRLFLLFLPFAVPLLLFAGRPLRRRLIVAVLCLGAVVAVDRGLARWQQSDEFRGYEAYNFARSRFHDTDGGSVFGPSTYRAAALVGWTRVDLHIYQIWITLDQRRFHRGAIDRFVEANLATAPRAAASRVVRRLASSFSHYLEGWALLVLAFAAFAVGRGSSLRRVSRRRLRLGAAALALVWLGTSLLMALRFVPRIALPLFAMHLVFGFLLAHQPLAPRWPKGLSDVETSFPRRLVAIALVCLGLAPGFLDAEGMISRLRSGEAKKVAIDRCFGRLERGSLRPEILIALRPDAVGGLGAELASPLRELEDVAGRDELSFRWPPHSPAYRRQLARRGLVDGLQILERTIGDPHALYVVFDDGGDWLLPLWRAYFRLRVQRSIRFVPRLDCRVKGRGLVFYQIHRSSSE